MREMVLLGEITCPSGELVLMDGGYLELWSGSREPDEGGVPHRELVRSAVATGATELLVGGVHLIAVGGLPTDRPLAVVGAKFDAWSWETIRIVLGDAAVAVTRELGEINIESARFVFGDATALDSWQHEEAIDGLADVVFWGRDAAVVAEQLGVGTTGTPGEEDTYGWLNLPVDQAQTRAAELDAMVDPEAGRWVRIDYRPHSHHWRVMAGVRASEYEAGTVEVGNARVMFAMTSVGDGDFPVHLELDESGAPLAIRVTVNTDE